MTPDVVVIETSLIEEGVIGHFNPRNRIRDIPLVREAKLRIKWCTATAIAYFFCKSLSSVGKHDPRRRGESSVMAGEEKPYGDAVWVTGQRVGLEEGHTGRQGVRGSDG